MNAHEKLSIAQAAATVAEASMLQFLIKTDDLDGLTVSIIKQIAKHASHLAFEATSEYRLKM